MNEITIFDDEIKVKRSSNKLIDKFGMFLLTYIDEDLIHVISPGYKIEKAVYDIESNEFGNFATFETNGDLSEYLIYDFIKNWWANVEKLNAFWKLIVKWSPLSTRVKEEHHLKNLSIKFYETNETGNINDALK